MKKQGCIICGKPLKNGIMINGRGICKCCESRLSILEMNTDFYEYYKDCIRKNIAGPLLRLEGCRCQGYHL